MNNISFSNKQIASTSIEITEDLFGGIIPSHRINEDDGDVSGDGTTGGSVGTDLEAGGEFQISAEKLGVTTVRFPGGSVAEGEVNGRAAFDWENPNPSGDNSEEEHLLGLNDMIQFCAQNNVNLAFVMPTVPFANDDGTIDVVSKSLELKMFIKEALLKPALESGVTITDIDLGNEYAGNLGNEQEGVSASTQYGLIAADLAQIIGEAIEEFTEENALSANWGPDLNLQVVKDVPSELKPEADETVSQDYIDYITEENSKILDAFFDGNVPKPALDYIDGLTFHSLQKGVRKSFRDNYEDEHFKAFLELLALQNLGHEFDLKITAWSNQSSFVHAGQGDNSLGAAKFVAQFHEMMTWGLDTAMVFAIDGDHGRLPTSLGNLKSDDLTASGELFRLMRDNLIGTEALEYEENALYDRQNYDINVYQKEGAKVLYISNHKSATNSFNIDLTDLLGGSQIGHVSSSGVSSANGVYDKNAEISVGVNADGSKVALTGNTISFDLEPYEILQIVVTEDGYGIQLNGHENDDVMDGTDFTDYISGKAGDDVIYGADGDDILNGDDGNDTLIGGGQHDILTGGAGNDVFVFSTQSGDITDYEFSTSDLDDGEINGDIIVLENTTSFELTTNGGFLTIGGIQIQSSSATGNIAVLMDSGTTISASGFGSASLAGLELVVYDTGVSEAFDTKVVTFADNNEISAVYTYNDDGTQERIIFDAFSSESWDTIVEYRNSEGQLYDKRTNYDDGNQLRLIFDTDASKVWDTIQEYRDSEGELYDKRTNYDDGSQLRLIFDTDASKAWETIQEYRDENGIFYEKRTNYDDGSQLRLIFDTDGSQSWDTIQEYRDANGELYDKRTNFDDGNQQRVVFDTDDTNSWDTILELRNADNELFKKAVTYDNGNQQLILFDVDDVYTWDTYARVFDSNGDLISETFL